MRVFARITKVDEANRTVTGVIADETPDRSGEVFDYATSKPHFQSWSDGISKATDGRNLGNVRVMHGNTVAGVTKAIEFDDAEKAITVEAKIVDDNEWKKTLEGCYTGFSIGGKYANKWEDGDLKRYTAVPSEYSLVDLPCNPAAQFTVVKAGGAEELRKFHPGALVKQAERLLAKGVRALHIADTLNALLGREQVAKGMWNVSRLADLLETLNFLALDTEWEKEWEGDGSPIPDDLRAAVKTLADILIRMVAEEVEELIDEPETIALAAPAALHKSEEDDMNHDEQLKKAADDLAKANAERDEAVTKAADLQKALDTANDTIAANEALLAKAAERITADAAVIEANNTAIAALKAAPAPVRAALTAVAKGADIATPDTDPEAHVVKNADGSVNAVASALKKALANPSYAG